MIKKNTVFRVAGIWIVLAAFGCGGGGPKPVKFDKKPTFPVTGRVTINGTPQALIDIEFVPIEKVLLPDTFAVSRAETDTEGMFTASTYENKDGVPAGEYVLLFHWTGPTVVVANRIAGGNQPVPDPTAAKLNEKYGRAHLRDKVVKVKVEPGPKNDLGTLELTTK